jgi:hypothetical protein
LYDRQQASWALERLGSRDCGVVTGTRQEPGDSTIKAQCSNGLIYALVPRDGDWVVLRKNRKTGAFEPD